MALFRSGNPALKADTFVDATRSVEAEDAMTINGTVNKTAILGLLVVAGAMFTWSRFMTTLDLSAVLPFVYGGFIVGAIIGLIIAFKKTTAPTLAPVYAVAEGFGLGGLSAIMETIFPGIVFQAVVLTLGILFSLLLIYRMGWIKVTENFKLMVASATMGIALCYFISIIGRFAGFEIPFIHGGGAIGIGFSLFVVIIASMNLVMDFDFIEQGAEARAPKYMEWYGAFGLMVTLIWLYIEILRLLAKLRNR
jgi:uncharacterized YccA/Bax inhibitor family protein